ncbi:MAG: cyclic nucleotide-binding domain-containing protein [Chloroflexi bacterium]|nr:cyclic nucleotide-binding domain-containing protein [Chloroflexota bacterium]
MIPVERLKTIPLFAGLDDEQLARLAPLFHHAHHKIGDILTRQGDPGDAFFVLENGILRVRYIDAKDVERVLGYLNAPAFFGETSLFTGLHRDVTIDVFSNEADLLKLPKNEFDELLNAHPEIREALSIRPEVQQKLAKRLFPWLSAGEIVLVNTRRHWYALAKRLVIPTLIAVALLTAALVVHQFLDPTGSDPRAAENIFSTISTVLLLLGLGWSLLAGAWLGLDWSNDHYVVTNKRVVHIEKVVFFFDEREEALIEQVTNVVERGTGWAQKIFDFTNLRVETMGRQIDVNFDYAPRSERIRERIFEQINRLKDRAALEKRERMRAGIREDLWQRLAPADITGKALIPPPPPAPAPPPPKTIRRVRFSPVGQRLNEMFGLEVEGPHQITWRKHWFVLIERVDEPLVAVAILLVIAFIHIAGIIPVRVLGPLILSLTTQLLLVAIWFILLLLAGFWLWYMYEDWKNDIYRVTDDRIVDIERSPLGIEIKQSETTLDRVQDISYVRQGVLAMIFNFGDLVIETAGAGKFVFYDIRDPQGAIQEIFRRRDVHKSGQQREQARQERREFLDWFMEYHRFLLEQGELHPLKPRAAEPPAPEERSNDGDGEIR